MLSNTECNSLFKLAALEDRVEEDIWVCAGYREGGKVVVTRALMPHNIMITCVARMPARETLGDLWLWRRGRAVKRCGSWQVAEMISEKCSVLLHHIGIISWGPNSCGEKYRPGVYTRWALYQMKCL